MKGSLQTAYILPTVGNVANSRRFLQSTCSANPTEGNSQTGTKATKAAGAGITVSSVRVNDQFIGKVDDVGPAESSWIDIGVVTSTGKPVRGRLRHRDLDSKAGAKVVGGIVPVYVHKIQPHSARIEVRQGLPPASTRTEQPENARALKSLVVGEKLTGEVVSLGKYGAVIDVNVVREGKRGRSVPTMGLLERRLFKDNWASEADTVRAADAERILQRGDILEVWVRCVHPDRAVLLLDSVEVDARSVAEERAARRKDTQKWQRRKDPSVLKPGDQRYGVIRVVKPFGVFVDIRLKRNGLVHFSEMGELRKNWTETLVEGVTVNVEVMNVEHDRISLRLISVLDEEGYEQHVQTGSAALKTGKVNARASSETRKHGSEDANDAISQAIRSPPGNKSIKQGEVRNETNAQYESDDSEQTPEKFSDEYFEDKYGF